MKPASISIYFAIVAFLIVCGGAVYEHVVTIPVWTTAPPESLAMFHGDYGAQPARFWQSIHPVALLASVIALALNWKILPRRKMIGITLGGYLLVLVLTAIYFVPELMTLTLDPQAQIPPDEWKSRADTWEILSLIRAVFMILLAIPLIHAATRAGAAGADEGARHR